MNIFRVCFILFALVPITIGYENYRNISVFGYYGQKNVPYVEKTHIVRQLLEGNGNKTTCNSYGYFDNEYYSNEDDSHGDYPNEEDNEDIQYEETYDELIGSPEVVTIPIPTSSPPLSTPDKNSSTKYTFMATLGFIMGGMIILL